MAEMEQMVAFIAGFAGALAKLKDGANSGAFVTLTPGEAQAVLEGFRLLKSKQNTDA